MICQGNWNRSAETSSEQRKIRPFITCKLMLESPNSSRKIRKI